MKALRKWDKYNHCTFFEVLVEAKKGMSVI